MSKNVIVLMDSISSFVKGFKRYIAEETEDEVICVDDFEEISTISFDYLLVEEEKSNQCPYKDSRMYVISDEKESQSQQFYRFDQPNIIYNQLVQANTMTQQDTKIISVYSMAGGTGKSVFATGLCQGLAYYGCKTLHLSLAVDISQTSTIDLSLLIYYLANNEVVPQSYLDSMSQLIDTENAIITCGLNRPEDSLYLTPEVVRQVIMWLDQNFGFHYMVVELPWIYGPNLEAVLRLSHKRIMIGDQRHSATIMGQWQTIYRQMINSEKNDYAISNRFNDLKGDCSIELVIPVYESHQLKKGMKEWCSKYLLTHWIR